MVNDLVKHNKPLAYIIGTQPFHPLPRSLLVRAPTLIPRPETEHWLAHLVDRIAASFDNETSDEPFRILDIGTGTGCIPLTLAHSLRHSARPVYALGVDQSPAAVELARENIARCGTHVEGKVRVVQGDLFAADFVERMKAEGEVGMEGARSGVGFDLVVSNPPYITRSDYDGLAPSVRQWEDRRALVGEVALTANVAGGSTTAASDSAPSKLEDDPPGDDGLIFYRRIVSILDQLLSPGAGATADGTHPAPVVAFEVGEGQAGEVCALLGARGYRAEAIDDQWGIQRLVLGYRAS